MRMLFLWALIFAMHVSAKDNAIAPDQESDRQADTTQVTQAQLRRVYQFMLSDDAAQRRATYEACRKRGEDFHEDYHKLIHAAIDHHRAGLKQAIKRELGPHSSQQKLNDAWGTWQQEATTARQFIQTNHDKDKRKHDEMDRLFAAAEKSWKKMERAYSRSGDHAALLAKLKAHASALQELDYELKPEGDPPGEVIDWAEIESEHHLGTTLQDFLTTHEQATEFLGQYEQTQEANDALNWASSDQKNFAEILNQRRVIVGLRPLTLNENLSAACAGHSAEMEKLKYFAHESPVDENRTPAMRAKKAGFERFAGECIFMGRTAPADAEQAWWYSDGHRLINYSSRANVLGIARHNIHWTLNTGR